VFAFVWIALPDHSLLQSAEPPTNERSERPLQTFTVTSIANSGVGTLRQAITDANANPGLDTIAFNLTGTGIRIIDISSVLPTVTSPVIIDGTSQPGYAGTPLVFIRANGTTEALKITAGGSTLKGLTFGNFDGTTTDGAINFSTAGGNVVTACTFGVLGDSTIDRNSNEVIVIDGISNNRVGGSTAAERNYFGGDTFNRGVLIRNGASNNRVAGNWFGVAPNGTAIPNRISVVIQDSTNNTVGGTAGVTPGGACTGECNVISGNDDTIGGVRITGATATGNNVISNFVGLLADGQTVNRNRIAGIRITGAPNNRIGGTTAAERNVITGNGLAGVIVESAGATGNIISGNYIGLKTDGVGTTSTSVTTATEGILLGPASTATRIGGTTAGERNVISGNLNGVFASNSSNNLIQGNYIGTDATGMTRSTTLNNGIEFDFGSNNVVGGTAGTTRGGACTGACNVISGNGQDGMSHGINLFSSNGNTIDGNYIGLNATGTAAMLNGITPNGATFNGKAIRLLNSNSNTIGRDMRIASKAVQSGAAAGPFLIAQDDVSGDSIKIDPQTGLIQGTECLNPSIFRGNAERQNVGANSFVWLSGNNEPSSFPLDRSYGASVFSGGGLGSFSHYATSSPSSSAPIPRFVNIKQEAGPTRSGDCPLEGTLSVCGPVEINGTSGCNLNLLFTFTSGTQSNGDPLAALPPYVPVTLTGIVDNTTLRDLRIIAPPDQPVISLTNTGVNNFVQGSEIIWQGIPILPPDPNVSYADPVIRRASFNTTRILIRVLNAPPNTVLTNELTGTDFREIRQQIKKYESMAPIDFLNPVTTDANGEATIDQVITEPQSVALLQHSGARLITSVAATGRPLPAAGKTIGISPRIVVPNAPFDWDQDGKTDLSVYRPGANSSSQSVWYSLYSSGNSVHIQQFGSGGDLPVTGDYNGDRAPNFAVWRPSNRIWYLSRLSGNPASNFDAIQFGDGTDVPVTGDFDGDGRYDVAVFRPANGDWYIRNSLGGDLTVRQWGISTDKLAAADYDGDGRTDLAVFRNGVWYINGCLACTPRYEFFGLATDTPVPADYDGDGKADIAVFRPSNGNWYVLQSSNRQVIIRQFGLSADIPVPGDYDGDGKSDIAIWRPSDGNWWMLQSATNTVRVVHWGQNGDVPIR
jgi:hypothetical protein